VSGLTESQAAPGSLAGVFERHGVALAVLVGLVARVVLTTVIHHWGAVSVPFVSDDTMYVDLAKALVQTGRIDTHHFPVGYPLFLAPFMKLGSGAFPAIRITQVLLGLLTIVLVSRIAAMLYGNRAGVIAAWLTALYPPLIYMTGRIMSETLFIALLMLSIYQFLLSDRDQSLRRSALAAALFGLASLVRSNLIAMLAFVPVWYLAQRGATLRTRLITAAVCTVVAGTILMLPGLYFLSSRGEFIPFATNAGGTFYGANNPLSDGGWVQYEDHPELLASIPPEACRSSEVACNNALQQLGVKWIRENPGAFLSLLPKKFGNAWLPGFQSSQIVARSKLAAVVLAVSLALLLLAAIAGRVLVKPVRRDGILLSVLATYTVMSLAFYGNPRIGLFCAPVLIVYAAAGVARSLKFANS
jgi:4-amino-4-deoxy-L-arabinose transferase-like glycosyltransferase